MKASMGEGRGLKAPLPRRYRFHFLAPGHRVFVMPFGQKEGFFPLETASASFTATSGDRLFCSLLEMPHRRTMRDCPITLTWNWGAFFSFLLPSKYSFDRNTTLRIH